MRYKPNESPCKNIPWGAPLKLYKNNNPITKGKELELIAGHPNRDKIDAVLEGFSEDQTEADSDDSKVNSPVYKVRVEHF